MRCMPSVVALRSVRGAGLLRALSSRRVPSACANHEPIPLFTRQIRADVDLAYIPNHHSHLLAWTNLKLPHRARRSENSQISDIDAHTPDCRVCQPRLVGTRKIPQTRSHTSTCTTLLALIIAFATFSVLSIFHKVLAVTFGTSP
jgi:hypothetical protein